MMCFAPHCPQEVSKERKMQEKSAREESNRALRLRRAAALHTLERREQLREQARTIAEGMCAVREENERRCACHSFLIASRINID